MGCKCTDDPETVEFLKRYGGTHAAAMHANREKEWTALDWRLHIEEEDNSALRPFMEKHYQCLLAVYDADHQAFIEQLARYGKIVDLSRLNAHAKMEEWVILQLIKMGY